jgi:hypothetical protein
MGQKRMDAYIIRAISIVTLTLSVLWGTGCETAKDTTAPSEEMRNALKEANEHFTYKGKPIHPGLVEEFEGWMSDYGPSITVTVNVAASFDTNEYYDQNVEQRGSVIIRGSNSPEERDWYNYERIGVLSDGTSVLKTCSGGGGSGVFMDLLFVRFSVDECLFEGEKHEQLLMRVVNQYLLGDRDMAEIKVVGDRVIVGASEHRAQPVTLMMR